MIPIRFPIFAQVPACSWKADKVRPLSVDFPPLEAQAQALSLKASLLYRHSWLQIISI